MKGNKEIKRTLKELVTKIKANYQPDKIILFGSCAYGNPTLDSDIDLLIIKRTKERPMDRRIRIRRMVSDTHRRIPFEPLVLTPQEIEKRLKIGDQFIKQIIEKGEILYAS
jgi:predicted nucleotidyltransferase